MRLTKWGYYADFAFYPLAIGVLSAITIARAGIVHAIAFAGVAVAAAGVWSAVEYWLHRWAFHRWPPLRRMHDAHHAQPRAYVGTPLWITAGLFAFVWLLLDIEVPPWLAGALTTGLMAGYLRYVVIHDAVHRIAARPGTWLYRAKVRHARHHHAPHGNFGVSGSLWDRILHTELTTTPRAPAARDGGRAAE